LADEKTFLDPVIDYPALALRAIGTNETVAKLLTNNPNLDMESDEADDVFDKYLYDYAYVDDTTTESEAYICAEVEVSIPKGANKQSFFNSVLYITIVCHRNYMKLDPTLFPGIGGNRRDNLVRFCDDVINGSDLFGVGKLTLKSVRSLSAPVGFSIRELVYEVPSFKFYSGRS